MRRRTWVLVCPLASCLLLTSALPACRTEPQDAALRTVRIFDLLVAFPRAATFVEGPGSASGGSFEVGGELRPALLLNTSTSVVFPPVRISADALLTFQIGVIEKDWNQAGDGVEFVVFAQGSNNARAKLFTRYLDPKHNPQDRRWFEARVPMRMFVNQDVRITLSTEPGPANDSTADGGVWAEPQVLLPVDH